MPDVQTYHDSPTADSAAPYCVPGYVPCLAASRPRVCLDFDFDFDFDWNGYGDDRDVFLDSDCGHDWSGVEDFEFHFDFDFDFYSASSDFDFGKI